MIQKNYLYTLILLISTQNYAYFGPIIELKFNGQKHNITVNQDISYSYRDLRTDIATEFGLSPDKIKAFNLATKAYLNLDSYYSVTNLNISKPLQLRISAHGPSQAKSGFANNATAPTSSLFDFLEDI